MEKINMEKKLLVSASPHIRDHISTRRIMLDVVIALAPAALLGIYYHGLRAALLIAVCIVSCVLFEYIAVLYFIGIYDGYTAASLLEKDFRSQIQVFLIC
jgi:Na+-transporting NADH:ubiquinone oxidoreductase subunit NqrB